MKLILIFTGFIFLSANALANEESFMEEYYDKQDGDLINVMSPCDPGCHVEIEIGNNVFSSITSGIGWERLYELEDEEDSSITLNYSFEKGVYVVHSSTNTIFSLNGKLEHHPIDFALSNCFSKPSGQTTMGMVACLRGAEETWDVELNRIYEDLGGANNSLLKSTQLAWISYRDSQYSLFNSWLDSKQGSKWIYAISKGRVLLIRQQVEHLQSFYTGY
ncbi:lysozyme inhibitor LprI family protein [Kangiella aquimarina]|uniref:Lysozyme inhibitor LprI family protein n=1 Tax=Kangiella aquimarina TaxID=261965 RepID=A0ABZ0X2S0_9GAMM|nr:lysozyme inhibitor LprI family protein [Kangiella aquimarina]WQG84671.1 lysozyme inhibitor LprI family protein [Kangiella aquimarina]